MYNAHFTCQILMKRDFLDRFSKIPISVKIRLVRADLFDADEQTDGR
jgi:hypothetical protein